MGIPADSEGTPIQCQSANSPRKIEKVEFYDEDTLGFSLTNQDFTEEINSELKVNPTTHELYSESEIKSGFFWRLPAQFTGNQLGSYGGELNFTLNPAPEDSSDVLVIMKVNF